MAVENNLAYLKNVTVKGGENESISWNKAFDSANAEYELKIPDTMKTANITLEMNEGMTATINGSAYTGKNEVTLEEGDTKVQIEVSKTEGEKTYKRTYTLNFARVKAISTLESMKVGNSNSFTGFLQMTPEFTSEVTDYKVDTTRQESFWRVWLKPTDVNSKITVTPVENVDRITTSNGNTSTQGHDRWNVYKKDQTKTAKIRVDVLSENGKKTTSYNLTLEVPVKVTGIALDKQEAELDMTEKLQLNAKIMPENATIQTVKWYSSDEETATVDEKGLVTPKKAGNAEITVISDDGASITDKCHVTITDKAKEVDDLIDAIGTVTLESKAKIDIARDAYNTLTAEQKERVTKLNVLEESEKEYDRLKGEADKEEADKAAAKAVDDLIEKIGEVTIDSGKQIQQAREAFEKLTPEQKEKVEKEEILKVAEEKYAELLLVEEKENAKNLLDNYKNLTEYRQEQQEELKRIIREGKTQIENATDKDGIDKVVKAAKEKMDAVKTDAELTAQENMEKAAEYVEKQIANIGEVRFTSKSRDAILFARVSYDKLEKTAQEKVDNYSVLSAAEAKWKELESNAKVITLVDEKSKIAVSGKFMEDFELHVEKADKEAEAVLQKEFVSLGDKLENLFVPYTISYEGGYVGEITVKIPVDAVYNGRNVIVKQLCGDNSIVSYETTVKENSVSVKTNTLGTFMAGVEKVKNLNGSAPKTADTSDMILWIGICVLSMVTLAVRRRLKHN